VDDRWRTVIRIDRLCLLATTVAATVLFSTTLVPQAHARRLKDIQRETPKLREGRDYLLHGKPFQTLKVFGLDPNQLAAKPASKVADKSVKNVADKSVKNVADKSVKNVADKSVKSAVKRVRAADLVRKLPKKMTAAERSIVARSFARLGRYKAARLVIRSCKSVDCGLAAARIERLSGSRKSLLKVLGKAQKKHPKSIQLTVELGRALYDVGQKYAARRLLDPIADLYQGGQVKRIADIVAVAESLALNSYFKDANDVIAEANEGATGDAERLLVELRWGLLFLSKYNFRDADLSLEKVLKIDPFHPEATVAMARIDLHSDNDVRKARKRLDKLIARQPRHPAALAMRAEVALRDEEPKQARRFADRALAIRPDDRYALAVAAAVALSADDRKRFAKLEKRALKHDPGDGSLYVKTAHFLELGHRYPEVLKLLKKGITKDPELWAAHAQLGMSYARIADDKNALKHLTTAFNNDPYNVRTANVLNVLYDGVLKHMHVMKGDHVNLRVHRKNRKAFERTVLPFLQDSYEILAKRYKMPAKKPLQVEIFPTTEQFSVRTVGLPRLGAHAVCFGHLITSRSPHEAPFNWKMVLHHEMSHIFHIQASGGRVPRWLTEGVAMMESAWLDPTWHIIAERRAYDRLQAGKLAKIDKFSLAFSQAKSMRAIVDAYYQAMLVARFLDKKWGFDKIRRLIAGHLKGTPTRKLIKKIYGVTPEQIDTAFQAWLATYLKRFDNDFRPTNDTIRHLLKTKWKKSNRLTEALRRALSKLKKGDAGAAFRDLVLAGFSKLDANKKRIVPPPRDRKVSPDMPRGRQACALFYLTMELSLANGDRHLAAVAAEALVGEKGGICDGVVQRLVLARKARMEGKPKLAVQHFEKAHSIDPRDGSVLSMWLKSTPAKDAKKRAEIAEKLLEIGPNSVLAPLLLAKTTWKKLAADLGMPAPRDRHRKPEKARSSKAKNPFAMKPAAAAKAGTSPAPTKQAKASKTAVGGLSTDERARLTKALKRAAQRLEEVIPTRRASVLYEARAAVVSKRYKWALPIYRETARRSESASERAEAWCELKWVADKAKAKDDAAEAGRRCAAENAKQWADHGPHLSETHR